MASVGTSTFEKKRSSSASSTLVGTKVKAPAVTLTHCSFTSNHHQQQQQQEQVGVSCATSCIALMYSPPFSGSRASSISPCAPACRRMNAPVKGSTCCRSSSLSHIRSKEFAKSRANRDRKKHGTPCHSARSSSTFKKTRESRRTLGGCAHGKTEHQREAKGMRMQTHTLVLMLEARLLASDESFEMCRAEQTNPSERHEAFAVLLAALRANRERVRADGANTKPFLHQASRRRAVAERELRRRADTVV